MFCNLLFWSNLRKQQKHLNTWISNWNSYSVFNNWFLLSWCLLCFISFLRKKTKKKFFFQKFKNFKNFIDIKNWILQFIGFLQCKIALNIEFKKPFIIIKKRKTSFLFGLKTFLSTIKTLSSILWFYCDQNFVYIIQLKLSYLKLWSQN